MYIKLSQNNRYSFYNKSINNSINYTLKQKKDSIENAEKQELQTKIRLMKRIDMTEEKSVYIVNDLLMEGIKFLDNISKSVKDLKEALEEYINPKEIETDPSVYSIASTERGRKLILDCQIKSLSESVKIYSRIMGCIAGSYKNNSVVSSKIEEVLKNTNNDESLFDIGYKALGLEGLDNWDLTKPNDIFKKLDNSLELINKKRENVEKAYSYLNNTYSKILNSNKNKFLMNNESMYINETI